ncbi:hypothetical protein SAY87_004797 [Trapa incisa]|uniref:SKP1-like protein n=1 Tax=Trapa incisa TaxID=236973 RepID=A0AAN7JPW5_9MYRT|nr:hypothetical protein SAY87_004797 [Trapa incisa]
MSSTRMITLTSNDGVNFEVDEIVAMESETKAIIGDCCLDDSIPIPMVDSEILSKVLEYCKKHTESPKPTTEELKAWDAGFVKVDTGTLVGLTMAASYLEMQGLFDLMCSAIADLMRGKTPEEIREMFEIENDFTPEEEEMIRKENEWTFE